MIVDRDVRILMSDGISLCANVFRPEAAGPWPVVMAMGAYGKDVHFEDAYNPQWKVLKSIFPGLDQDGSTGRYLRWEVVDPERWVSDDFVVIQVDSRGTGKSPGYLDPFSPLETRDYYECIEWAGVQPWSNGKVGLIGVSYLAIKQWQVAALRPPHLAAMVPWEGSSDLYREGSSHGGILSNGFTDAWWPRQVLSNQYGSGESTHRDRETGLRTTGPSLNPEVLRGSRADHPQERRQHKLFDAWHQERCGRLESIEVPLLSAANWGGPGMHLRGNFEGWRRAGSAEKWLFAHIGTHYESFYLPHYVQIQKRFFNHFLRHEKNGWEREPRVQLAIRRPDGTAQLRHEDEWPLARTQWTRWYLHPQTSSLSREAPQASTRQTFRAMQESISFSTPAFEEETEFTGPAALRLWVSSSTHDMDVFAVLRVFDPQGQECTFVGAHERVPMAMGWLRASHRKLDPLRTEASRPYHTHDELQPLTPGEPVPLDIEIWPTTMVFPKGYRLVLTLQGHDFVIVEPGRLLHNCAQDRPQDVAGGLSTIHTGANHDSYLLMPHIPAASSPLG